MASDAPQAPQVRLVDDAGGVAAALGEVDGPVVGVDVERADADRYHRRAALVQVGVAGRCVLLDGVRLDGLAPLDTFLGGERTAVFHAVENDLEPLAAKGVQPSRFADTAIAAALLGLPTGLATLLDDVTGVALDADKNRLQRADWGARPLTGEMIAYAAGDVVHLPALWAELARRLESSGRREWYDQELARVVTRATEPGRAWTRVKGAGKLGGAERAVLRAVWEEREALARTHDIAPNRLLHDDVLRDIAVTPPASVDELVRRSPRRRGLLREFADALLQAVRRGAAAEPEERTNGRRREPDDRAVFDALRTRRAEVAERVGIDAGVLCPAQPLWAVVDGDPRDGAELCRLAGLDGWRVEVLADPLWQAYLTARFSAGRAAAGRVIGSPGLPSAAVPGSTGG